MTRDPDIGSTLRRILVLAMAASPAALAGCSSTTPHADAGAGSACEAELLDASITETDAGTECYAFERFACGLPDGMTPNDAGCSFALSDCKKLCHGFGAYECHTDEASCVHGAVVDADATVMCAFCSSSAGRRPHGLRAADPVSSDALGDFFARAAHLEAASVPAFRALARALGQLGAPSRLRKRARSAARDEVRHARVMGQLAARFGATPAPVEMKPGEPAELEGLAIDNAVEGMVRETLGALIASWQARHAHDRGIREALRRIAADETRHAELSWAIGRWAESRLGAAAMERVGAAARREIRRLANGIAEPDPALVGQAGLPPAVVQHSLLRGLERELWAAL